MNSITKYVKQNFSEVLKHDKKLYKLISKEFYRQKNNIDLIASENIQPKYVSQALMSPFSNKYAEGYPGSRYYGGTEICDELEELCQERAKKAFNLNNSINWQVNVQPLSGSPANLSVFAGVLQPKDTILSMSLSSGGHLSHGHSPFINKVFNVVQYSIKCTTPNDIKTAIIDYDEIEKLAIKYKPKIIIVGVSAFPRELNYKRIRDICDKIGAFMMADISHISGLIAGNVLKNSPFLENSQADIITTTTHKTLKGSRGGLIFTHDKNLSKKINTGVFPSIQGGPHMNQIAGIAASLNEPIENKKEFVKYQKNVLENTKNLAELMKDKNYNLLTNGTDLHMFLMDVTKNNNKTKISGKQIETIMDKCNISVNRNSLPGDKSVVHTSGIRIGCPAITARGFNKKEIKEIADLLDETIEFATELQKSYKGKGYLNIEKILQFDKNINNELELIKKKVEKLTSKHNILF